MTGADETPFPLDGGRVGDGGDGSARKAARPQSAPEWAPRKSHAAYAIPQARRLRQDMTAGERRLWTELRKLKMNFRRQQPVGRYVADFALLSAKLIVEIDGYYHTVPGAQERDAEREEWLKLQGFRVIRFTENDVASDLSKVMSRILAEASPPSPTLPPSRGKGAL